MARAYNKAVQEQLRNPAPKALREWKPSAGPYGRGDPTNCYNCSLCEKNDHDHCERLKMMFCGCWRNKHNRKARSLYSPPVPHAHNGRSTPARASKPAPKPVPADDDWGDEEYEEF